MQILYAAQASQDKAMMISKMVYFYPRVTLRASLYRVVAAMICPRLQSGLWHI